MPCRRRPKKSGAYPCERAMTGMLRMNAVPLRIMSGLRPIQSASRPAKSVEKTQPSSTAATMMESCDGGQLRGGFEIGQRAADDADIDAVEQAAEAGHEQEERDCSRASHPEQTNLA